MAAGAGLHSSGVSSSSPLMERAEAVLRQVQSHGIHSTGSIISCLDLYQGVTLGTPEGFHKKFGDKYFEYFDCSEKLAVCRLMYQVAYRALFPEESDPCSGCVSAAVALHEGVGVCGELSYLTHLYAEEAHLHSLILMLQGPLKPDGTISENPHALVIVSDKPIDNTALSAASRKGTNQFVETMKHLPDYVVVDPYLGKICKAQEVDHDPDFMNKLKAISTLFIEVGCWHEHTPDKARSTIASLHERVSKMDRIEAPMVAGATYVRSKRIDLIKAQLENLYKSAAGSWERSEDNIIFKGSKEERDRIHEVLKEFGISLIKGKIKSTKADALVIPFTKVSYNDVRVFYEKVMELK